LSGRKRNRLGELLVPIVLPELPSLCSRAPVASSLQDASAADLRGGGNGDGSAERATSSGRGYAYGGPAFVGGILVGVGLGILLGDFGAWFLIGIGPASS
jgi:hypothetical protein